MKVYLIATKYFRDITFKSNKKIFVSLDLISEDI